MTNLLNKLRMLDAEPKRSADNPETSRRKSEGCYRSEAVFPLSTFCNRAHATQAVLESIYGCEFPANATPEDILFLDTETTGLSGGVGTIAFQIGIGYFTQDAFVVEQLMMHDYHEEAQMLQILASRMKRYSILCTFNGRTFDVPLLKSRFLMNRMKDDCFPATHADALFPSRRLWKLRLKQCSLANLEEKLLGVVRDDDLPGALVPQTFFQYLKDGDFTPLLRVIDHNKQDIVSLAQLFYFLCKQHDRPEDIDQVEDLLSLAKAAEKQGNLQKATKCYRLCAHGSTRADAYRALASSQKRQGHADAAIKLYQAMVKRGDDPIHAFEALAKLYEHQRKDPEQALHYTRQALLLLSEPSLFHDPTVQEQQIALQYRYQRLRRKILHASDLLDSR